MGRVQRVREEEGEGAEGEGEGAKSSSFPHLQLPEEKRQCPGEYPREPQSTRQPG